MGIEVYAVQDVSRRSWWPLETAGNDASQIDSVWFFVDPQGEPELLRNLRHAWADLTWFGMGTRFTQVKEKGDATFFGRFPNLLKRRTRIVTDETLMSGRCATSEWGLLDPASSYLSDFMEIVRRGRSRGATLALAGEESVESVWHAISFGFLWRTELALDVRLDQGWRLQRQLMSLYLTAAVASGLAPLVPLDRHPWGGYVLFGEMTRIREMARPVGTGQPVDDDSQIEALINDGGGLAI